MTQPKGVVFDEGQKKESTHIIADDLDPPTLSQPEKESVAKEAYKEALKEVYKERIEEQQAQITMPEQGKIEGIKEEKKETAKKQEVVKEKVKNLANQQELYLFKANTIFPFDLFPDTILIDPTKVTVITKEFFATEQICVINLKDIFRAEVETVLFLANLIITFIHMPIRERMFLRVNKLKRSDALKAKALIDGLILAIGEGADLSVLSYEEIMDLVQKLVKYRPIDAYQNSTLG